MASASDFLQHTQLLHTKRFDVKLSPPGTTKLEILHDYGEALGSSPFLARVRCRAVVLHSVRLHKFPSNNVHVLHTRSIRNSLVSGNWMNARVCSTQGIPLPVAF